MSYDPAIGRWLQTDPEQYTDGANLYQMERGSPVALVDPEGTESEPATQPTGEQQAWQQQQAAAQSALDYWTKFLDLRMGNNKNGAPITADCKMKFLKIIRAISWVESKHGTAGRNQPGRDPMQSGNPGDLWWQTLTGQQGNGDRFIGGPNAKNYWAVELPGATGTGPLPRKGHDDPGFTHQMSYFWAVPYLIHLINKRNGGNGQTYTCGSCDLNQMLEDAAAYNGMGKGAGNPNYLNELKQAMTLIGD